MEFHDKVQLGRLSDLVNEETCRIVSCLLDYDRHLIISDIHHEKVTQFVCKCKSNVNLPDILTNDLEMTKMSAR